ncbi:MAG TPA: DnaA/Hda family protein [Candidatus Hydrogenedentes bacterium]|nr:DnaA/Hda family protein [Candidatus Hydrogenedentota bacterium]
MPRKGTGFRVTAHNREAVAVCKEIASLSRRSWEPVVLVGNRGVGKTYLLSCLARYLREASVGMAVACLSPVHFPSDVRALIADPGPIAPDRPAALLVDALERFNGEAELLEAVVRVFVERGHAVVATSTLPPAHLDNLTPGLRVLLARGRTVAMSAPDRVCDPSAGALTPATLSSEVARLHRLIAAMRGRAAAAEVAERELCRALEQEREISAALARAYETVRAERRVERRQARALYTELLQLRETLGRYSTIAMALPDLQGPDFSLSGIALTAAERVRVMEAARDSAVDRATRIAREARAENTRQQEEIDILLARLWDLAADLAATRRQLDASERLRTLQMRQFDALLERRRVAEAEAVAAHALARDFEVARDRAWERHAALCKAYEELRYRAQSPAEPRRYAAETAVVIDRLVADKTRADALAEQLERRLRASEEELVRARLEMDALVGSNERVLARASAMQERVNAILQEHARQSREIEALHAARARAEAHATETRALVQRLRRDLRKVARQRDALLAQLDRALAQREALRGELRRLHREHVALETRWDDARRDATALREELRAAAETQQQLREGMLDLFAVIESLQRQLDILHLHVGDTPPQEVRRSFGAHAPSPRGRKRTRWLGEVLTSMGAVTRQQLDKALRAQAKQRIQRLGEVLIEQGVVSEDRVLQAVARQQGLPFLRILPENVKMPAATLVPESAAREYRCIPLHATDRELVVAMADPLDRRAIAAIAQHAHRRVRVVASPRTDIEQAWAWHYAA